MSYDYLGARKWAVVTPSDATNFTQQNVKGLYVGVGGTVAAVGIDDAVANFVGVQAGSVLPLPGCKRVNSTNTTASSILVLYD